MAVEQVRYCARSACRQPMGPDQAWFNRSTRGIYCTRCARILNRVNKDGAQQLYGGPLCVKETEYKE